MRPDEMRKRGGAPVGSRNKCRGSTRQAPGTGSTETQVPALAELASQWVRAMTERKEWTQNTPGGTAEHCGDTRSRVRAGCDGAGVVRKAPGGGDT